MNITFWVTEDCNLRCKYCYVNKNAKYLQLDDIDKAFELIKQKISDDDEKIINVNFHGGEPTLNFPVIYKVVNCFSVLKEKYDISLNYYITTNGTAISNDAIDFLIKNNFNISISVDGKKNINDKNRVYRNGKGSFDKVKKTLNKFKLKNYHIRIRITITPQTVPYLFESYKYFYDSGFIGISAIPDTTISKWSINEVNKYMNEMRKILNYLKIKSKLDYENFIHNIGTCVLKELNICDGGINTFHISANGDIYPCALVLGIKKFKIGSLNECLYHSVISNLTKEYSINNKQCSQCDLLKFCEGNRCKFINYASTKQLHKPSASYCILHRKNFEIYRNEKLGNEEKI